MRAHHLPLRPDYIDFGIETAIFALAVMIIVIAIIVVKAFVFLIALIIAIIAFNGIEKRSDRVYSLAFTRTTRSWMKRRKRY